MDLKEVGVPVFVFPLEVKFYTDDPSSHKQVISLFNPYKFDIKYKVLCTGAEKFAVYDNEGKIFAGHRVDVAIRHMKPTRSHEMKRDKFRFLIFEAEKSKALGKRDVPAMLLPTEIREEQIPDRNFEDMPAAPSQRISSQKRILEKERRHSNPSLLLIIAAILSIVALMLPTAGESNSANLPIYFHMTLNQKLIAAYVLGLVTMVLLRS